MYRSEAPIPGGCHVHWNEEGHQAKPDARLKRSQDERELNYHDEGVRERDKNGLHGPLYGPGVPRAPWCWVSVTLKSAGFG